MKTKSWKKLCTKYLWLLEESNKKWQLRLNDANEWWDFSQVRIVKQLKFYCHFIKNERENVYVLSHARFYYNQFENDLKLHQKYYICRASWKWYTIYEL